MHIDFQILQAYAHGFDNFVLDIIGSEYFLNPLSSICNSRYTPGPGLIVALHAPRTVRARKISNSECVLI